MLQRPHALQARPVLEPEHMVLRVREPGRPIVGPALALETRDKRAPHELVDARARLVRDVALAAGLHGQRRLEPDDEVGDARREAVGPVVAQDAVVPRVGEWGRVVHGERVPILRFFCRPPQPPLEDVVGDGAVLGSDVVGPGDVAAQVGGSAHEGAQIVVCW